MKYVQPVQHNAMCADSCQHVPLQAMVAGRPEALSPKLLSACIQRVISQPVLPGYGDVPAFLLPLLDDCQPLLELAQRHAK